MQNHAVVWLDHREAHIFLFDRQSAKEIEIASHANHHLHHKAGSVSGKRSKEDQAYFNEIIAALKTAGEWLVMGPGSAKLEFVKHVNAHAKQLSDNIIGVETADHPSGPQILAHARSYFNAIERTRPEVKG